MYMVVHVFVGKAYSVQTDNCVKTKVRELGSNENDTHFVLQML